jgi:hypothetical protein
MIERFVAGRGHEPGARPLRDSVDRPAFQSYGKRFLDGVLGKVQVSQDPRKGCDNSPRVAPEGLSYRIASESSGV